MKIMNSGDPDPDWLEKISSSSLDHIKDQDQLSNLDLSDQDNWSFYSSALYPQGQLHGKTVNIQYHILEKDRIFAM